MAGCSSGLHDSRIQDSSPPELLLMCPGGQVSISEGGAPVMRLRCRVPDLKCHLGPASVACCVLGLSSVSSHMEGIILRMSGLWRNINRNVAAARARLDSVACVGLLMRQAIITLHSWRAEIEIGVAGCSPGFKMQSFKIQASPEESRRA